MRVFIFDEQTDGKIEHLVARTPIEIISPQILLAETKQAERQSWFDGKQFASLESIDLLILEITGPNTDINFLLAQAILQQKPTLCLYRKNNEPRDLLTYLIQRGTPKCIKPHAYSPGSLANVVDRFLADVTQLPMEMDEVPSIKFTLRMTPKVDRYLDWKAKNLNRTKADVLRDWLRLKMDEDGEFQKKIKRP